MSIDPAFRALLDLPGADLRPPPPELGAAGLRAALAANPLPPVEKEAVHEVRELTVQGAAGAVRVRLYRPSAAKDLPLVGKRSNNPSPTIFCFAVRRSINRVLLRSGRA